MNTNTNINANYKSMFSKKEDDITSMEKKMNKIIKRKKYKENYKNITELNNIYETNTDQNEREPNIEALTGRFHSNAFRQAIEKNKSAVSNSSRAAAISVGRASINSTKAFEKSASTAAIGTAVAIKSVSTPAPPAVAPTPPLPPLPPQPVFKTKLEQDWYNLTTALTKLYNTFAHLRINKSEDFKDLFDKLRSIIPGIITSISELLLDMITALPSWLDNILHSILLKFVMIMNNAKNNEQNTPETYKDVDVLKTIIYSFIAFPIAIFVCYNWLFLVFYKNEMVNAVHEGISFDKLGVFKPLFEFFFFYAIKPLYYFDKIALNSSYFPTVLEQFPYRILVKLLLIVISYLLITYSGSIFSNAYKGKYDLFSLISSIIIAIYFGLFLKEFVIDSMQNSFTKMIPPNPFTIVLFIIIIVCVILYLLLKGAIAYYSVHLSVMIVFLYFFVLSFFGISMYAGDILANIKKIDDFIKDDIKSLFKDEKCEYKTIFEKILIFVSKFLYGNLFSSVYFIILFFSFFVINNKIHSMNVKMMINILVFLQVILLLGNMFHKNGVLNRENDIVVTKENMEELKEKYSPGYSEASSSLEELNNVVKPVAEIINNGNDVIPPQTSLSNPDSTTTLNEEITKQTQNAVKTANETAEILRKQANQSSNNFLDNFTSKAPGLINSFTKNISDAMGPTKSLDKSNRRV